MSTSMSKARLSSIPPESLRGKNVFLRVDFNVPLELQQEGNIVVKEDARIRAELPTITHLMQCGAKTILCSHLGRPRGVRDRRLSLAPVAARLNEYCPGVTFVGDCVGEGRRMAVRGMQPGQVLVLENVRYYNEEYLNNSDFAAELAEGMDIYVNDAFGSSHRVHASVVGVAQHIPRCVMGFLMTNELLFLGSALDHPNRPLAALVGGAKVSSKLDVMLSLLRRVDKLLVGGAMVYTFLRALGHDVGESLVEEGMIPVAKEILEFAQKNSITLVLGQDSLVVQCGAGGGGGLKRPGVGFSPYSPTLHRGVLTSPLVTPAKGRIPLHRGGAAGGEGASEGAVGAGGGGAGGAGVGAVGGAGGAGGVGGEGTQAHRLPDIPHQLPHMPMVGVDETTHRHPGIPHLLPRMPYLGQVFEPKPRALATATAPPLVTAPHPTAPLGHTGQGTAYSPHSPPHSPQHAPTRTVSNDAIPAGWMGVDIGPETVARFTQELADCRTVLWNGPMGITEKAEYSHGTEAMALCLRALTQRGATTIICGGETVAAVESMHMHTPMPTMPAPEPSVPMSHPMNRIDTPPYGTPMPPTLPTLPKSTPPLAPPPPLSLMTARAPPLSHIMLPLSMPPLSLRRLSTPPVSMSPQGPQAPLSPTTPSPAPQSPSRPTPPTSPTADQLEEDQMEEGSGEGKWGEQGQFGGVERGGAERGSGVVAVEEGEGAERQWGVGAGGSWDEGKWGFSHVSTGGGAALEFLEGRCLPGVEALDDEEGLGAGAGGGRGWMGNLGNLAPLGTVMEGIEGGGSGGGHTVSSGQTPTGSGPRSADSIISQADSAECLEAEYFEGSLSHDMDQRQDMDL